MNYTRLYIFEKSSKKFMKMYIAYNLSAAYAKFEGSYGDNFIMFEGDYPDEYTIEPGLYNYEIVG